MKARRSSKQIRLALLASALVLGNIFLSTKAHAAEINTSIIELPERPSLITCQTSDNRTLTIDVVNKTVTPSYGGRIMSFLALVDSAGRSVIMTAGGHEVYFYYSYVFLSNDWSHSIVDGMILSKIGAQTIPSKVDMKCRSAN